MKLSKIALAVMAASAAAGAVAAPVDSKIALSSGASAVNGNHFTAFQTVCQNAAGRFASRFTQTGNTSNVQSFVCATQAFTNDAAGRAAYAGAADAVFLPLSAAVPFAEVRVNVAGGSFTSITTLNNASDAYYDTGTDTTTAFTLGTEGLKTIIGGFSDVEPQAFRPLVVGTNVIPPTTPLNVNQTFGVAVSAPLYAAMLTRQQGLGVIPATCAVTDTAIPGCVPSIGKAEMVKIIDNDLTDAANANGAAFLGGAALAGQELRYLRRVDTSGTQASAEAYFLGTAGCTLAPSAIMNQANSGSTATTNQERQWQGAGPTLDDDLCSIFTSAGTGGLCDAPRGALIRVLSTPGTGDVRNELNKASIVRTLTDDPALANALTIANYAIGIVSGENATAGATWRFVRINGASLGLDASPAVNNNATTGNKIPAQNGQYDFFFQLHYNARPATTAVNPDAAKAANASAYFALMATDLAGVAAPGPGLWNNGTVPSFAQSRRATATPPVCGLPVKLF